MRNDKSENKYVRWAYGITLAYFIVLLLIASLNYYTGSSERVNLNELGDFFAGAMSPLAIFWLIMVYMQQRKEMAAQIIQTENIADETRKQVVIMDEQFKKQYEPFLVCHEIGANEVRNDEIEGNILVENIGGVATNLQGSVRNDPDIKIVFMTFEVIQDTTRSRRNNRRDAAYIGNGQQCYLNITIPFKNDQEKYQLHPIQIYYKDMLGRQFELLGDYQLSGNRPSSEALFGSETIIFKKENVFPNRASQIDPFL